MGSVRLGSAKHLGENPAGTWTLRLRDAVNTLAGTLDSWSLTVYGHKPVPRAPTLDTLTPGGGSLAVAWTAPTNPGGSTITAYDVRYIQTADDETDDANWTVVDDAWTTGSLTYTIAGLPENTEYDVQVRAVNATGDGAWSGTTTGTTQDHGDTTATATSLTLDTDTAGAIASGTDVDYFTFTLTQQTDLLVWTTGALDTVGELQDSSGTELVSNDDNPFSADDPLASAPSNFFLWKTLAAGTYYIKVTSYGGTTGSYVLRTKAPVDSSGTADARAITFDSDGIAVERGLLDPGGKSSGDSDYFELTLSAMTDILIHTTGSIRFPLVILLRSDGTEILRNSGHSLWSGFERQALIRHQFDAGTYYIRIKSNLGNKDDSGFYNLHVSTVTDLGDTTATAPPLRLGEARGGEIASAADVDYFRLEVSETTDILVRAGGRGTSRELLDEDGNTVTERTALAAGTYYLKVTASDTGKYSILVLADPSYYRFLDGCEGIATLASITDPLYGCQWHLNNVGQRKGAVSGEDMNVEEVWAAGILGAGINVAVVDTGMDSEHEDLSPNVETARNHDYTAQQGEDPTDIYNPDSNHGTAVAGIIAARDNSLGVRGVAPRATVYGYNFLLHGTDANMANAMKRDLAQTHVSNNSWVLGGNRARTGVGLAPRTWEMAIETGLAQGAGGKGIVYVFAAGNNGPGDYANLDGVTNHYGVTAVCAVTDQGEHAAYSEQGPNLWVCAPSASWYAGSRTHDDRYGITTTDNDDVYIDGFGGTSAATPIVSGVVALIRSANPALTWRDVKLILAESARKTDADDTGWEDGALKYGADTERYHFNHTYGFGVADAKAAVDLAAGWTNLPTFVNQAVDSATSLNLSIPDCPAGECPNSTDSTAVSRTLTMGSEVEFIEFVEININLDHARFRDLQIELVSPAGTVSVLSVPKGGKEFSTVPSFMGSVRLGSAKHLGENPAGTWTLRLRDAHHEDTGTLNAWSLTVYGHRSTPGVPTLDALTPGAGSLAAAWTAPTNPGASAITAYEVRYIKTAASATDKADDSNWTEVDTGWTADATLAYTLSGLDTVGWDVQVRAVNDQGDSAWSSTLAATPLSDAPSFATATTTRNVAENTTAGTNVGAPVAATDPNDTTLTYTLSGTDAGSFAINNSSGQLTVGKGTTLDYETTTSYAVTVTATDPVTTDDPTADAASIDVTINVTNVNEPPTLAGQGSISYVENGTASVDTYTATDPEGETITWSVAGDDADDFAITNGVLRFSTAPDYESPADTGGNNVYQVTVQAFDGTHTVQLSVTVTVTNVDEDGVLTLPPRPLVNVAFPATLSDPDGPADLSPHLAVGALDRQQSDVDRHRRGHGRDLHPECRRRQGPLSPGDGRLHG